MKACAFTGHRRIESRHMQKLPELVLRAVQYAYDNGCRKFITGGAIGFDTLAAREVIKFRISHPDVSLVLALPCIEQDAKWNSAQKNAYSFTLAVADEVIYTSEVYTKNCMAIRNRYLADKADLLIAYVGRSNSGAAQTVRMAESMNKRIYNLYPTVVKTLRED